ncbi:MAG: hypothetical protein V4667_12215 [Bacteroidota bacterium]
MKRINLVVGFASIIILLTSCEKFPENPALGFVNAEKQITDYWIFTEFYVDDVDSMEYFRKQTKSDEYYMMIEDRSRWANERIHQRFSFAFYSNISWAYESNDVYPSLKADWKLEKDNKLKLYFISCSSLRETYYKQDSCFYREQQYPFEFTRKFISNSNSEYRVLVLSIDKLYKNDLWLSFDARNKKYVMKFKRK